MISTTRAALAAAAFASLSCVAGSASAGPISDACMASSARSASYQLCGCIQQAANLTLNGRDQRQAAKFILKPDMAQDVKMSKSRNDEIFWEKYSQFGTLAQQTCSAG